jgi:hypothetical protein
VNTYFGRLFNHPHIVFTEQMLRPELQDLAVFVDGMDNIVTTQQRVAQNYFNDGSIEMACPPLKALLHIMRDNQYEGRDINDPTIRGLFTRQSLLASAWYRARLEHKQQIDIRLWERHVRDLENYLNRHAHDEESSRLHLEDRLDDARMKLNQVRAADYLTHLQGSIGAQPI